MTPVLRAITQLSIGIGAGVLTANFTSTDSFIPAGVGFIATLGAVLLLPRTRKNQNKTAERNHGAMKPHQCPNCGHDKFLLGPEGGAGQDVVCCNCFREYVICIAIPNPFAFSQDLGEIDDERLRTIYGRSKAELSASI